MWKINVKKHFFPNEYSVLEEILEQIFLKKKQKNNRNLCGSWQRNKIQSWALLMTQIKPNVQPLYFQKTLAKFWLYASILPKI